MNGKEQKYFISRLFTYPHITNKEVSWREIKNHIPKLTRYIRRKGIKKYIIVYCADIEGFSYADIFFNHPSLSFDEVHSIIFNKWKFTSQTVPITKTNISHYFNSMSLDIEELLVRAEGKKLSEIDIGLLYTHYFLNKLRMKHFSISQEVSANNEEKNEFEYDKNGNKQILHKKIRKIIKNDPRFYPITGKVKENSFEWDYYNRLFSKKK